MKPPRVGLVGLGGYARVHLQHLRDFHTRGELELAAAVAFPPEQEAADAMALRVQGCRMLPGFAELLAALPELRLDLVVVPTPIHLHAPMTLALLRAGANVLVEKPITASPADAEEIARTARECGRMVAVGFQYLHAPEVLALKTRLLTGAIGPLRRLVVHAAWPRGQSYYTRNNWAGRLSVDGQPVLDSPVNNAMSHFLMLMLFLAGRTMTDAAPPVRLSAELYRAQPIESFDTAVVRLETAEGCQLDFYGTHSSREIGRPCLRIEGRDGSAEWVQDGYAGVEAIAGRWRQDADTEAITRERMLHDVLGRLRGGDNFICSPELAALHVRCVASLHTSVPIVSVPAAEIARHQIAREEFIYVRGLDELLASAARHGTTLAAAGASWATPPTKVTTG
jgi:predicted dehydrogenase